MSCLEETVAHYIAALLTYTKAITEPFLKRMEADYQHLSDFFEKNCAKERVRHPPRLFCPAVSADSSAVAVAFDVTRALVASIYANLRQTSPDYLLSEAVLKVL